MRFTSKIEKTKIKHDDAEGRFNAIADACNEWAKEIREFHHLKPAEQMELLTAFGIDMNVLAIAMVEYANPRTDDVADRGNQI